MLSWKEFAQRYAAARQMPESKLLFDHKGVLYPSCLCSKETFEVMDTFEARKDDVLMASYPKCGTNWTIQLLNDIVYTIHNKPKTEYVPLLESGSAEHFEDISKMPSPRLLATHMQVDYIPKSIFKNKSKILLVLRNPKDTAVSCYHFCKSNPMLPTIESWDDFFPCYMNGKVFWGSYFDYVMSWNKHADDENVLIITFEEMKKDLAAMVRKISNFFGYLLTEEQINVVANKGAFMNMKKLSSETHGEFGQPLFRKGEIGDWRNIFSDAQNKEMDLKFEKLLAGTKVGEKINYNVYCK